MLHLNHTNPMVKLGDPEWPIGTKTTHLKICNHVYLILIWIIHDSGMINKEGIPWSPIRRTV